jgi:hypothetical protein
MINADDVIRAKSGPDVRGRAVKPEQAGGRTRRGYAVHCGEALWDAHGLDRRRDLLGADLLGPLLTEAGLSHCLPSGVMDVVLVDRAAARRDAAHQIRPQRRRPQRQHGPPVVGHEVHRARVLGHPVDLPEQPLHVLLFGRPPVDGGGFGETGQIDGQDVIVDVTQGVNHEIPQLVRVRISVDHHNGRHQIRRNP